MRGRKIGFKISEKTRNKLKESHKGLKYPNRKRLDTEARQILSDAHKGHKQSEETKKKRSEKMKGHVGFNKGNKLTIEQRKHISEGLKGKYILEKASGWKGGKSFELYSTDWTNTLKKAIRERDHYICQICYGDGLTIHHIDYNKKNCNPNNLICLCKKCHAVTNHNRNSWIKYFIKLLELRI